MYLVWMAVFTPTCQDDISAKTFTIWLHLTVNNLPDGVLGLKAEEEAGGEVLDSIHTHDVIITSKQSVNF